MDQPRDIVEKAAESVNLREQGPSAFDPFELVRSDHDIEPTKALLKISHDMTRVLERLIAPKAPIDMVSRLLIRPKTPFQLKVYDVVTKGLFSNPRHQNHRTC